MSKVSITFRIDVEDAERLEGCIRNLPVEASRTKVLVAAVREWVSRQEKFNAAKEKSEER